MAGARRLSGLGNVSRSLPFSSPGACVDLPPPGNTSASISSLSHTTKVSGHFCGLSNSGISAGDTSGQRDAGADATVDADDDKETDYVAVTNVADSTRIWEEMSPDSSVIDEIVDRHHRAFMERAFPPQPRRRRRVR